MAANASSSYTDDEDAILSDINVTPLVDVTLVLLIVFMITIPAIVGSAPVKVELPESSSVEAVSELLPMMFVLKRGDAGAVEIYLNERRTSEEELRKMIAAMGPPAEGQAVSLSADRDIAYGEVVGFMDMLHGLGLKKLSLETRHVEPR